MLNSQLTDSLLSAIPYQRITSWSMMTLGISSEDFSNLVVRLHELEEEGCVDLLTISRQTVAGSSEVNAVKFIRLQSDD